MTLAATTAPTPDWRLAVVLVALVALGVGASYVGKLGVERETVVASVRAVAQLAVVSLVIALMPARKSNKLNGYGCSTTKV